MANSKSFLKKIYPTVTNGIEAKVDIVAVHGLDPFNNPNHAEDTWTAPNGKLWLRDFLPHSAKTIRVLLYGYNSSAVFGASTTGVHGAAENLLNYLRIERKDNPDRPIVWVAHSLGGIVVEKAIITAYVSGEHFGGIHDATRGVIFFGTPHRGGHRATFGDRLAKVVRALSGDVRNNIVEALRKDSMFAEDIDKDFVRRARALNLRVLSFIESLPIARHIGLIVPPSSATLNWDPPAEIQVRMEATHKTICKFADDENALYKHVEQNILELLAWATSRCDEASVPSQSNTRGDPFQDRGDRSSEDLLGSAALVTRTRSDSVGSSTSEVQVGDQIRGLTPSKPPELRSRGSWFEALSGLRPLFTTTSATPSQAPSVASDDSVHTEPKLVWPVRTLPHPRATGIITRASLFERLLIASGDPGPVALHGIGGAGKTQLAIRLAYWFLDKDPDFSVFWINADTVENCEKGIRNLAATCGIISPRTEGTQISGQCPPEISLIDLLVQVRRWFQTAPSRKWLLVLDSADDADVLTLPPTGLKTSDGWKSSSLYMLDCISNDGFIVFTTKSRSAAATYSSKGTMLEVGRFDDEEATLMLEMHVNDDLLLATPATPRSNQPRLMDLNRQGSLRRAFNGISEYNNERAVELAEKLDHLPLALSQAAAFMNKNGLSINAYLAKLNNDETLAELMARPQPHDAETSDSSSVYATWRLSYESIRAHHRLAADVLALMSFLESQSIPLSVLQAAFSDNVRLIDALGELKDYDLIHSGSAEATYTMHRLVQATTQRWLKESKLDSQWARAALMTISDKFSNPVDVSSWPVGAAWLSHAEKILRCPLLAITSDSGAVAALHVRIGLYYFQMGQFSLARTSTETAYNIRLETMGPLEPLTLAAREQLVYILRELGQFTLAEQMARDLKRYRKRKLGRKHELVLQSYQLLSLTLQDQGQYADATRYAEKALKGFKDLYAVTDPLNTHLLLSTSRVGLMYERSMAGLTRSEALLSEALEGYKQRGDGAELPAAHVLNRLSYVQRTLGKYRESEKTAYQAQELRRRTLGPEHPDTYKCLFSAGWSIKCQERYEESADIFTEIVAASKKVLGERHASTYTVSFHLAESLEGLGEYEEAQKLHEHVLNGRRRVLRDEHPDILTSQVGLARVLHIMGNSGAAEQLSLDVYKTLKRGGSIKKERTLIAWMCMSNLAKIEAERAATTITTTTKQAHWKEAIKWSRLLVQGEERMFGSEHPETKKATQQLMGYLNASGDHGTASSIRETLSRVTSAEKEKLG